MLRPPAFSLESAPTHPHPYPLLCVRAVLDTPGLRAVLLGPGGRLEEAPPPQITSFSAGYRGNAVGRLRAAPPPPPAAAGDDDDDNDGDGEDEPVPPPPPRGRAKRKR